MFSDLKPGALSGAEAILVQGDSGSMMIQLLRTRFLRKAQLTVVKKEILLADSSHEQVVRLSQAGNYTLRINKQERRKFILQTSLEKQ